MGWRDNNCYCQHPSESPGVTWGRGMGGDRGGGEGGEVRVGSQHPPNTPTPHRTSPSLRRSASARLLHQTACVFLLRRPHTPPILATPPRPSRRPTCAASGLFSAFIRVLGWGRFFVQNMQRNCEVARKVGATATEWLT